MSLTPAEIAALKKHLGDAKSKSRYFAFSAGKDEHSLILSDKKIAPDVAKKACTRVHGTTVVTGVCFTEEGTLVFEMLAAPPNGMADMIKKAVKVTSVSLTKVLCRKADKERGVHADDHDHHDKGGGDKGVGDKGASDKAAGPKPFSIVAFQKSRIRWDNARKKIHTDIRTLQEAIRKTEPEEAEVAEALDEVLEEFNTELLDVLDDGLNAKEEERAAHHKRAVALIKEYRQLVNTSEAIKHIDRNPFVKLSIEKDLSTTLQEMASQLGA
jgi:hypothetical protein